MRRLRRHLHHWTAALVILGFGIGWIMVALPLNQLLVKFLLFQAHKSFGLIVAGLVLVRMALAARVNAWPRGLRRVLFVLLLLVPALGYLTAATAPADVPTLFMLLIQVPHIVGPDPGAFGVLKPAHMASAIALVALAAWHAAGVIRRRRAA